MLSYPTTRLYSLKSNSKSCSVDFALVKEIHGTHNSGLNSKEDLICTTSVIEAPGCVVTSERNDFRTLDTCPRASPRRIGSKTSVRF